MTTDYDVLKTADPIDSDAVVEFSVGAARVMTVQDLDVADDEPLELDADPDRGAEELVAVVIPRRADEFTCVSCYLVQHKSRVARQTPTGILCPDCA